MRILVEMVDAVGVQQGSAALDAVHFVPLFQKELGEVGAVLTGYAGDQSSFQEGVLLGSILCHWIGWYLDSGHGSSIPSASAACGGFVFAGGGRDHRGHSQTCPELRKRRGAGLHG